MSKNSRELHDPSQGVGSGDNMGIADSVEDSSFAAGTTRRSALDEPLLRLASIRYPVIRIQYAFALSFYPRHQGLRSADLPSGSSAAESRAQAEALKRPRDRRGCVVRVEMQAAMSRALRE